MRQDNENSLLKLRKTCYTAKAPCTNSHLYTLRRNTASTMNDEKFDLISEAAARD